MPSLHVPLADSDFGALLEATRRTVEQLALPFLAKENIHIQKLSWLDENASLPYCTIVPRPEVVDWRAGPTSHDDIIYSAMVAYVAAGNRVFAGETLGTQLYWRQKTREAFLNRDGTDLQGGVKLPAGHHLCHVYVEAGEPYIEPASRAMYDAQYWLIRFKVRELRT